MKKNLMILVLFGLSIAAKGQETSVEKSIFGVQAGLLGIWIHNEAKLSNQIALRSEIGLDGAIHFGGGFQYDKTESVFSNDYPFIMLPIITLEPRWYYNFDKRISKSKNTKNNNGNFVGLATNYYPDWFIISGYDNQKSVNQITIIPKWGIRRNLGKHFVFETGIGLGYRYTFAKKAGYLENESEAVMDIHLRIGYNFKPKRR